MVGKATHCNCNRLHVGTRVYLASDVGNPGFRTFLAVQSRSLGLSSAGQVTGKTEVYVTEDPSSAQDSQMDALSAGARIVSRVEYETMLNDICRRGINEEWAGRRINIRGKRVYLVLTNLNTIEEIGLVLRRWGASVGKRIVPTLGAAVVSPQNEEDGKVTLLRARDVPVFRLADFRRLYE